MSGEANERPKYDWYQTDSQVVITLMVRNLRQEDIKIDFQEKRLAVDISNPSYHCEFNLAHPVQPDQCTIKIMSTKVEIKLRKSDSSRWNKLEGDDILGELKTPKISGDEAPAATTAYPSSAKVHRDWNKIAKDAEEDKDEEDPLNSLFKQIYSDGTDETRKAMVKSFTESGGTVLSTNWGEVKAKEVEVKPPDGMEYKKYEH